MKQNFHNGIDVKFDLRKLIDEQKMTCSPTIQTTDIQEVEDCVGSTEKNMTNLSDELKDLKMCENEQKKAKLCLAWKFSKCSLGKKCSFAHGSRIFKKNTKK